jgi:hypothetical protein
MTELPELTNNVILQTVGIIDYYNSKGGFQTTELKLIGGVFEMLQGIKKQFDEAQEPKKLSIEEVAQIIKIIQVAITRVPTETIDIMGQVYATQQHFIKIFNKRKEDEVKEKQEQSIPTVEEL